MGLLNAFLAFTNADPKVNLWSKCGVVCIKALQSFEILTVMVHHPHCLLLQQKIPPATSTLNLSVGTESA